MIENPDSHLQRNWLRIHLNNVIQCKQTTVSPYKTSFSVSESGFRFTNRMHLFH